MQTGAPPLTEFRVLSTLAYNSKPAKDKPCLIPPPYNPNPPNIRAAYRLAM